jgi:hypothetical protein
MTLKTLFKKQVSIRFTDDQTALVCTAKWFFLSRTTRIRFGGAGPDCVGQAAKREEFPMLGRIPLD